MDLKKAIHQNSFESLNQELVVGLLYAAGALRDKLNAVSSEHGFLVQHYNVLRILNGAFPEVLYPADIKERMIEKGVDLTRLLYKLERLTLIERNVCPDNRRRVELKITPKGISLLASMKTEVFAIQQSMFKGFSEDELTLFSTLLNKLE